ncbi:MAG: histidine kinase [Bacteroidota bacterium]
MRFFFIRDYTPSFILQIFLLYALIYYTVPQFLFKKKYIGFLLVTIPLILLSAYICIELGPEPIPRGSSRSLGKGPPFMASWSFKQLLIMSVTSLSTVLIESVSFAQQKERSEILSKVELMKSELKFLKTQINPHFLFNALNNIYALSVTDSEKTQEGISTLSLMLRYVLYDCERPEVPLRKELEYITYFIELFKLKSSKGYNISFLEEVEGDAFMVPPMLFIPFIENAFKHSGIEKRGNSFVNISLKAKDNSIEFSVENSLPSQPLVSDSHSGIGLQNVKKRLNILYPQTHQLDIKRADTFRIRLKMQLQ